MVSVPALPQGLCQTIESHSDPEPLVRHISPEMPDFAQALYRLLRRRERVFAAELFSEPAWDLLLDLVAAETSGNAVSITSACIAAAAPTTTSLRCLRQLEQQGIVYREPDTKDRRRMYIRMSKYTNAAMEGLLMSLSSFGGAAKEK